MKKSFLYIATIALILCACSNQNQNQNTVPTSSQNPTYSIEPEASIIYKISPKEENKKIKNDDGNTIISINISVPQLSPDNTISQEINGYYQKMQKNNLSNAELNLQDSADSYLRFNSKIETPYYFDQSYTICLNNTNYISIKRLSANYSGGLHESYTMYADNFSLKNGGKLALADLFAVDEDIYSERIAEAIQKQITPQNNYYKKYEDMLTSFDRQNFYITQTHLVIFYQQYDLGAYSAGIPEFAIPFEEISDIISEDIKNGLQID